MRIIFLLSVFLITLHLYSQQTTNQRDPRDLHDTGKNIHKNAKELPYFRLPWLNNNYDRWSHSQINRPELTEEQIKNLPSRVDNSENNAWQGIGNQKDKNCCSQEGTVAGMISYEINALNNTNAKQPENSLPTHFSWNLFNNGSNKGAEMINGMETAFKIGIPTQKAYGGRYNDTIGYWPNGYSIWHNGMKNRIAGYDFFKIDSPEKLPLAKAWLFNHCGWFKSSGGGVLSIDGTDPWSAPFKKIPKGEHGEEKFIWTDWGDKYQGHVMCVVGYDDNIGFDVNGDGKITNDVDLNDDGKIDLADFEKGAFIIANSWGTKWANKGKIYALYRCLMSRSYFWDRGPFLGYVAPAKNQPRVTLRFKATHNVRNALRFNLTLIDQENRRHNWHPEVMFKTFNGTLPLGGPNTDEKDFEWGFDLTQLTSFLAGEKLEEFLTDFQNGKIRLEISFSQIPAKNGAVYKGELKETELKFWDQKDSNIKNINLLTSPSSFANPIKISFPETKTE